MARGRFNNSSGLYIFAFLNATPDRCGFVDAQQLVVTVVMGLDNRSADAKTIATLQGKGGLKPLPCLDGEAGHQFAVRGPGKP